MKYFMDIALREKFALDEFTRVMESLGRTRRDHDPNTDTELKPQ